MKNLSSRPIALCLCTIALAACASSTKSFEVSRVEAYGFMKCANSTLKTQLRYQVKQPNDSTLVGSRKVGSKTGTLTVHLRGMPAAPVLEVVPDNVPDSDRDALLKRCSEWTR